MPVTNEQIREFELKVKGLQSSANNLSDDARRAVLKIVDEHRRKIKELIDHYPAKQAIPAADVPKLSQQIQAETNLMIADMTETLKRAQQGVFNSGLTAAKELASAMDLTGLFNAPTTNLLSVATNYTADLVQSIGGDLMPKVNALLSRSALGGLSPYDTMQQMDELLGRKGDSGVSFQAERIVRTEVNRMYSVALDSQVQQMTAYVENPDELEKEWVSGPWRPGRRKSHHDANGQRVPVNDPFVILDDKTGQKIELQYPRDPAGPAAHTIMCGCGWRIVPRSIKKAVG